MSLGDDGLHAHGCVQRLDEAEEELQRAREEQGLLRSRIEALEEEQRQKQELVVVGA